MCKKFLISTQANAAPDAHLQKLDDKIDNIFIALAWVLSKV